MEEEFTRARQNNYELVESVYKVEKEDIFILNFNPKNCTQVSGLLHVNFSRL